MSGLHGSNQQLPEAPGLMQDAGEEGRRGEKVEEEEEHPNSLTPQPPRKRKEELICTGFKEVLIK